MPRRRTWTDEQWATARHMRFVLQKSINEIAETIGMNREKVRSALHRHANPQRAKPKIKVASIVIDAKTRKTVPLAVLADRDRRATLVPSDTTALLMGDPPKNYRESVTLAPSIAIVSDPFDALVYGRVRLT